MIPEQDPGTSLIMPSKNLEQGAGCPGWARGQVLPKPAEGCTGQAAAAVAGERGPKRGEVMNAA